MTHFKTILVNIILIALSSMSTNVFAAKNTDPALDRIIAVVNDSVITQTELDDAMASLKKQLASSNTSAPAPAELHKRVLDQLIDRKIQLQLGEQAGLKITDDQVTKAIQTIATQNRMTVNQLMEQVTKAGMNEHKYRKEISEEIAIQTMQQQEVGAHINITPQEVEDFMRTARWKAFNNKEYHLEDILIALPNSPTANDIADAKKEADGVFSRIIRGVSFNQVAAAEATNNHILQGGDLGWLKLPQVPPAFSEKIVHLKKNDIYGPIATPNGFHIIRLVDSKEIKSSSDSSEQRKQVQQILFQRKMQEGVQAWLSKIHSEAFINRHPEG